MLFLFHTEGRLGYTGTGTGTRCSPHVYMYVRCGSCSVHLALWMVLGREGGVKGDEAIDSQRTNTITTTVLHSLA